jgi:hypothetical protein
MAHVQWERRGLRRRFHFAESRQIVPGKPLSEERFSLGWAQLLDIRGQTTKEVLTLKRFDRSVQHVNNSRAPALRDL